MDSKENKSKKYQSLKDVRETYKVEIVQTRKPNCVCVTIITSVSETLMGDIQVQSTKFGESIPLKSKKGLEQHTSKITRLKKKRKD